MKNKKTYYLLILDRSGSMSDCMKETISGFNEQIQMIRDIQRTHPEQEFYVSLTTFNHSVENVLNSIPSVKVKELTRNNYIPEGCTALLDAIGESVLALKSNIGNEIDNGEATAVVVILTDGYENASKLFRLDAIRNLIRELEATNAWTFSFLGTTKDAVETAVSMNIKRDNSISFEKSSMLDTFEKVSNSLKGYAEAKKKGKVKTVFLKK